MTPRGQPTCSTLLMKHVLRRLLRPRMPAGKPSHVSHAAAVLLCAPTGLPAFPTTGADARAAIEAPSRSSGSKGPLPAAAVLAWLPRTAPGFVTADANVGAAGVPAASALAAAAAAANSSVRRAARAGSAAARARFARVSGPGSFGGTAVGPRRRMARTRSRSRSSSTALHGRGPTGAKSLSVEWK